MADEQGPETRRAQGGDGAGARAAKRSARMVTPRAPRHGQNVIVPLRERHDGWTAIRQRAFLRALSELGSVRDACELVGLSKTSAYRLRTLSAEFAAAWDRALEMVAPILEQAAYDRGVEGWDEPVFYMGEVCGYRRRYSDQSLKMLLQARKSREAPVPDRTNATTEELIAFARAAAVRAGGNFYLPATIEETNASILKKLNQFDREHERARVEALARGEVWLEQGCYPPDATAGELAARVAAAKAERAEE